MTKPGGGTTTRTLCCERCGASFSCDPKGGCWCAEEAVRMPLPEPGRAGIGGFSDCLCRDCLRIVARETSPHAP